MTLQYSTNFEAALEILKLEEEPMHYKRITELAIERKLLPPASDARKTPDQTMYAELYRSVKSAEQKNSIPNFKLLGKGIFSLHPLYRSEIIQRDTQGLTPLQNIQKIVEEQNKKIHRELLQLLLSMNPYSFEQVCGAYFKEMGYQDVDVTKRSNDGGVDVIANVKLGINEMLGGAQRMESSYVQQLIDQGAYGEALQEIKARFTESQVEGKLYLGDLFRAHGKYEKALKLANELLQCLKVR